MATPGGDVSVGGQPRYVVAYTLKQAEQKQPDILNPDSLQSIKEVTSNKSKSPVVGSGSSATAESDKLLYSGMTANPPQSTIDCITVDGNLLDPTSYYIQPPHFSILGSGSCSAASNEAPHEYSVASSYSTVIVAQPDPYFQSDYRLLGSVKEEEERRLTSRPAEFRYSGSDFSMSECISNSTNTSTLGANKNRNRHIITDSLPGPESCV